MSIATSRVVEKASENKETKPKLPPSRSTPAALDRKVKSPPEGSLSEVIIPVVAEELEVAKRMVETGRVRVTKTVEEYEQSLAAIDLLDEQVVVDRVPIGRFIEVPPAVRQEGNTLVVPVVEEQLIVTKRLVLKEELRITRTAKTVTSAPQRVRLRRENVRVERTAPNRQNPKV